MARFRFASGSSQQLKASEWGVCNRKGKSMPMVPSFLAGATYGSIKLIGYFFAARAINTQHHEKYSPFRFALLKTGFGLLGGVVFLFFATNASKVINLNEEYLIYYAAPVRYLIWFFVLKYCWKKLSTKQLLIFSLLGLGYTYLLDALMQFVFNVSPGMKMPWC